MLSEHFWGVLSPGAHSLLIRAGLHEGRPHPGWMHTDFAQRDVVIHVKTAGNDYGMLLALPRHSRLQLHANRSTLLAMRAVLHARVLAF